ncbi:hypothetical protein UF75_5055 [Desulfosporosinus sp. I2]|uniref:4Fe-4S dicluster domain-containing protein n=1 Tax=Desulfosporosinus sp. I2 TaxID=1617025 RepID=UPI00061E56FB|nr:4Fe-4S dicluster domain-containing protein [Desulfosporosinus sp. I2]KJR44572.1 hypothetical protein UF75_5055 [Desulfosporosinus sp. I2]
MCPVGAVQNIIHSVGSRFGFTFKMRFAKEKCVSCATCVKTCPMGSLQKQDEGISYQILNCITCRQCEATCPRAAISFGLGKSGRENEENKKPEISIPVERALNE